MQETISTLLGSLMASTTFEEASASALRPMLALASAALERSPWAKRGRILRGMVHLRPGDGYRRLVVLENEASGAPPAASPPRAEIAYLPSATAWRWVAEHRCPVSIDVNLGSLQPHAPGAPELVEPPAGRGFDSNESRARLLDRAATHVHVLPLRGPGGAVDGMITLEADCRPAMGKPFIWTEVGPEAQILADVAAVHLATLPSRPQATPAPDEHLPVIGPSMAGLVEMLRVFAQQDETILLGGPTGAGKSRLARWCHEQSPRRDRHFETLDLVTVPEELQMGELFGWRKGAFTGAVKDNPGCVLRAEGGTLFVDEIDKLSLRAQAGMLHLLEERTYRPLGEGAGDRRADVRFVVGTNADLAAAVRAGRFREDLYYRIHVLPVKVPPLEQRRDEIALWAGFMATRRHRSGGLDGEARLTPEVERVLLRRSWPGNLRQLDNIVRRAYALALMEHGSAPRGVLLEARHFDRALAYEERASDLPLLQALEQAAAAFVTEAERRSAAGAPLDLDLADALRGLVLAAATQRLGRDEAFRILGRESLLANRNHHKSLKRELDKVEALCRAIGEAVPPLVAELADGKDH